MYKLILASESPRRRQLLQEAGFHITVHPTQLSAQLPEILNKNLNVEAQIQELAGQKSMRALQTLKQDQNLIKTGALVVLSADTMVVIDGEPLGKPSDNQEAAKMLRLLSGRTHQVMTGVSLRETESENEIASLTTTEVEFLSLTDEQIWSYIKTKEPLDKAGSYGIQGLGRHFVSQFRGSYSNVVGLPMEFVIPTLKAAPFWLKGNP